MKKEIFINLLHASLKLEKRSWFKYSVCSGKEINKDMAEMRKAMCAARKYK